MQFPLPDASIMLWFLQRNQRARVLRATLTQKAIDDKHKKTQKNPELTTNNHNFNKRIITA